MSELPATVSFGQWTPDPWRDVDMARMWPLFSLRTRKDESDQELTWFLEHMAGNGLTEAIKEGRLQDTQELLALSMASANFNGGGILRAAIDAPKFNPAVFEWVVHHVQARPWDLQTEGLLFAWTHAGQRAFLYAMSSQSGSPKHFRDALAQSVLNKMNENASASRGAEVSLEQENMEALVTLYEHNPLQAKTLIRAGDQGATSWNDHLATAVKQENEQAADILINPVKMGQAHVIKAFLRENAGELSYSNILWLSRFLAEHPTCAQAWRAADGVVAPHGLNSYHYAGGEYTQKILGRAVLHDQKDRYNSEAMPVAYSANLTESLILARNNKTLKVMASTESGRAEIVRAVKQPAILLALFGTQGAQGMQGGHGITPGHLLQWGGDAIRQWRDEKNFCMGHYAVAVSTTENNKDLEAMKMLRWVPEWDDVQPNNGETLSALVTIPKNKADCQRITMRKTVGRAAGVSAVKRRM